MAKLIRIMGQRGRTTIPYELRLRARIRPGDIVSFEQTAPDSILVRREAVCTAPTPCVPETGESIEEFLDTLTPDEQRRALVHLSVAWAAASRKEVR